MKENTPEKDSKPEKQVTKKDATDLIDTESQVTKGALDTAGALVNSVITNKVEVNERDEASRVGTTSNNASSAPTTSLINVLTDNKMLISNDGTLTEENQPNTNQDKTICDNDMISQVSSQTKAPEDERGADPKGDKTKNTRIISITQESLVRESSTDVEQDDLPVEDMELNDEVKAELDKLDVFLDDEESNDRSSDIKEETEKSTDDQQEDGNLTVPADANDTKNEPQDRTVEEVHKDRPITPENDNQAESDIFTKSSTADDDPALVVVPDDGVDSGSECQVGLEGCTLPAFTVEHAECTDPSACGWNSMSMSAKILLIVKCFD